MSDADITLDHLWLGDIELANLAGSVLTQREDAPDGAGDSIWRGDPYGSVVIELLEQGAGGELIRRELERVLVAVELAGVIESVEETRAELRALDVRIAITAGAVTRET